MTGGLFTVAIDFGNQFNGQENFLQTGVQCSGDVGFTALTPRTALKPAPYSISTSALRGRTVSDSAPAIGDLLAWNGSQWAPSAGPAQRKYYLTSSSTFDGSEALTACSAGYHMASLAEIFDPTNLDYNSALGVVGADSGGGPPFSFAGWVRTGVSSSVNAVPGNANCAVWTSNSVANNGTTINLQPQWATPSIQVSPWDALVGACNATKRVWCVED